MAVTVIMEDSLVGSKSAMEAMEAVEAIEATVMDWRVPVVVLAATREVGRCSTKASHAVVDTNHRLRAATCSKVVAASVMAVEAYVSAS
jgi:hypothetical protein